jgi:FAD/FMN-containing dehydrogenase
MTNALKDFSSAFKGSALRPADSGYDEARQIWNARAGEQQPALIVQPTDVDDVVVAVQYAKANDLSITARGGGHGVDCTAMADGALVIDFSEMKAIEVDPSTDQATLEAGVRLGEMDAGLQEHGLVVPAGVVTTTGVAGLTLGGGIGHLTRRFGATVDSLLAIEAVTAEGEKVTASADSNPELFWGMRGAGHNLAIATAFTFQAHKLGPEVMSGMIVYSPEEAIKLLDGIDEAMTRAPRELGLPLVLMPAPPLPFLPPEAIGSPILFAVVVYSGDPADYEAAIAPVKELATPLADLVKPATWLETNSFIDPFAPAGRRYQAGGAYLPGVSGEIGQKIFDRLAQQPPPTGSGTACMVSIPMLGGALFDRDEDSTAFSRVGAQWLLEATAMWEDPEADDAYLGWIEDIVADLAPDFSTSSYVNLCSDRGPEWLRGVYGSPQKWERIVALKQEWDPENRLRHNKNVARAAEDAAAA